MKKAKVLFEYTAQESDELQLQLGDIILEVEPADTGWCSGLLNGKRGMFPDNFVEMLEEEEKKVPPPPSAMKKPTTKRSAKKRMRINFAYTAENSDELSLEIGDIVEIVKEVEEGWAEGKSKGKTGVFPTNFGEVIPESSESEESGDGGLEKKEEKPTKEESLPNDDALATSSQKKVKGVGFGNIFGDGPIKLRQRSIGEADRNKSLSAAAKAKDTTKEAHPSTVVTKPKKYVLYCKVMFDYKVENDDELPLQKGEVIIVTDKEGGDDGWWEGEKVDSNGKKIKGVFPDNFVVELSPEEAREHEKQLQAKSEPDTSKDVKFAKSLTVKEAVMPPSSMKKSAPLVPAPPSQAAKPALSLDNGEVDEPDSAAVFDEPTTTEHTLAHVKRPAGPKNRRKPGAAERREKAQSAVVEMQNGEAAELEDEKPPKTPTEPSATKRDSSKRGVAVLPGMGGSPEGASGETPSWLQNLKNRQSQKRPPVATPSPAAAKPTSPSDAKPNWLQNLKKRPSSEIMTPPPRPKSPERAPQPAKVPEKTALQPPGKPANGHAAAVPPAKPAGPTKPVQKPTALAPSEKPLAAWQIERQAKSKKVPKDGTEDPAPEPPVSAAAGEPAPTQPAWKNSLPRKSPTVPQAVKAVPEPVKKEVKPPIGTPITAPVVGMRAKPAPPKGKPAPAAKPASSSQVEELKDELKQMKDAMEKMKEEMKKELQKLSQELQDEKKQRVALQGEVSKLRQQLSS